jgi:hypothetical protein
MMTPLTVGGDCDESLALYVEDLTRYVLHLD